MVDNKRLDELMWEQFPHVVYSAEDAVEFLKNYKGNLEDENETVKAFVEQVDPKEYVVIKDIGKTSSNVIRSFDDEESAKLFVSLLRESEEHSFIKYRLAKVIKY